MGYLNETNDALEVLPYFNGSLSQLYLVKAKNSLIVKSLKPLYCARNDTHNRFMEEVRILKNLEHERTPTLVKYALQKSQSYFAYQYIDGTPLETLLCNNTLTKQQSIDITRQLLSILSSLHERKQPIIHSDLSPANIIYTKEGQVHLIDFGCAKQLDSDNDVAHTWIGKHAYLSPEQAQGHPWNTSSDLYQVGLLFYEMLTGKRRNQGTSIKEILPLAANPDELNIDHIEEPYRSFLKTILSNKIENRFQSAQEAILQLIT